MCYNADTVFGLETSKSLNMQIHKKEKNKHLSKCTPALSENKKVNSAQSHTF